MKNVQVKCNLCENNEFNPLFTNIDHLTKKKEVFNLVKCRKCGLVQLNPKPKNIEQYYLDNYEPYNPRKKDFYFSLYKTLIKSYYKKEKSLSEFLKSFVCQVFYSQPTAKCGKVLDLGCGSGGYLSILRDSGWEVYGLDFSQKAVDFAKRERGLTDIKKGDVEKLDFPDNFFDLITMNHLIEHLLNPKEALVEAKRVLKKGGILAVTTPNFSSFHAKIFKTNWFPLETPRHLFLFETQSLKKMIEEVGGFKVTKIKHDYSTYCFARSLEYLFGDRPLLNRFLMMIKIIFLPYTYLLSFIHKSDVMTYFFKKQI